MNILKSTIFSELFLAIIFFFPLLKINTVKCDLIRDTEIEKTLYEWSNPIFKVANIAENSIKINVIANNEINAFVTDGKNMYLNTGLIIKAGSASGLIGVIAHETGHIAAGHILKMKEKIRDIQDKSFYTNLIGVGLYILGSRNIQQIRDKRGEFAKTILSLGPDVARRSFFSFSRSNEYVADSLGIKYLKAVNRSPASLGIILKQLYGQELLLLERQDPFLRTHPLTKDRMAFIERTSQGQTIKETREDREKYSRIKAKLQGFLAPPGRSLLNNKGDTLSERYTRAIAYFRTPVFSKAIEEINLLIKDYPNDPYFFELKGQIYAENGQIDLAIKAYRNSLIHAPESPLIMLALANVLLEKKYGTKNAKEAKILLENVIQLEPDNILAWRLKAISHGKLEEFLLADLAAAEENYRRKNYKDAAFFSQRVLKNTKPNSPEAIRADDILEIVK